MKKLLAILLSAMLVFSMVACSNDTPSPQTPVETPTELDKVNDKLESAESAFENVEVTEGTDGSKVQTVSDVKMDGYTIKQGTKTLASDGTQTTDLTIEYEENGQKVQIQDIQSEKVSVSAVNSDGDEVVLEDEVAKEATETALTTAKEIPASQFVRTGENEYTYTPASTMARLARTGESVSKVVIKFTYEDNKAIYTYEVTYITAGNTLTVTQEVSKETKKSVWDEKTEEYVESNDDIKDNLMNDFSLGNLQPGGNSFYREEALDAAYILSDYADNPNDYIEKTDASLSLKTSSGKEVAFTIEGTDDTTETEKRNDDGSTYTETVTDIDQTITVDAFNLQGIPILSDYIAKGDTINLKYYSSDAGSQSSTSNVNISVKPSEGEEKLTIVMTDNTTSSHSEKNGESVSTSNSTGTIKVTASGAILVEGTVNVDSTYSSTIVESPDEPSLCKNDTTTTIHFTTFNMKEIKELFGLSTEDELTDLKIDQYSEYTSSFGNQISDEISSTEITVNNTPVDYDKLLSNLAKLLDGAIDFINDGLSFEFKNNFTDGGPYTFDYYVYNTETETGSSTISVDVSSRSDTVHITMKLKRGIVDDLISLFKEMMSGSGEAPNINPNKFGSGNINNTSEYLFTETFFGAKNVNFSVDSPMTGIPSYTIEFKDGYMKGAYTFSDEELWNSNMYY